LSWSQDLKCEHIFHNECLIPWLMNHDECPYCRTVILDDSSVNARTKTEVNINDGGANAASMESLDINEEEPDNSFGNIVLRTLKRFVRIFLPLPHGTQIGNQNDVATEFTVYSYIDYLEVV